MKKNKKITTSSKVSRNDHYILWCLFFGKDTGKDTGIILKADRMKKPGFLAKNECALRKTKSEKNQRMQTFPKCCRKA